MASKPNISRLALPLYTKCGLEAGGCIIGQLLLGLMKEVKDVFFVVYSSINDPWSK